MSFALRNQPSFEGSNPSCPASHFHGVYHVLESGDKAATLWSFAWRPQVCGSAQTAMKGPFSTEFCARSLSCIFKCPDTPSVRLVRRSTSMDELATRHAGGDLHHFGIPTLDGSDDAELLFLLGPAMRQRAGERGDREVGGGGAVGDGFDNARRHEGERNEAPDVALDLVLASGNRLE